MRTLARKPALAWLALALCLGGAGSAFAKPDGDLEARLETREPLVRQMAPVQDAALIGGRLADLRWEELAAYSRLEEVEEWEAFLSVDGGKSYPFRITPHLDADVRRLRWHVPAVATADARLLFRFGTEGRDGEVEIGYAPPIRFRILVEPAAVEPISLAHSSATRGEAALPGQQGVLSWVAGSRRGTGLQRFDVRFPIELHPRPRIVAGTADDSVPFAPDERRIEVRADLGSPTSLAPVNAYGRTAHGTDSFPPQIPPLLQTQRRNE
jgi:hypothetical protein